MARPCAATLLASGGRLAGFDHLQRPPPMHFRRICGCEGIQQPLPLNSWLCIPSPPVAAPILAAPLRLSTPAPGTDSVLGPRANPTAPHLFTHAHTNARLDAFPANFVAVFAPRANSAIWHHCARSHGGTYGTGGPAPPTPASQARSTCRRSLLPIDRVAAKTRQLHFLTAPPTATPLTTNTQHIRARIVGPHALNSRLAGVTTWHQLRAAVFTRGAGHVISREASRNPAQYRPRQYP